MEDNSSASEICVSQPLAFTFVQIKLSSSILIMNCMLIISMDKIESKQFKWKRKQNRANNNKIEQNKPTQNLKLHQLENIIN